MTSTKCSKKQKTRMVVDRSSILVSIVLVFGASINIACDNKKKPKPSSMVDPNDGASPGPAPSRAPSPSGSSGGSGGSSSGGSSDVSSKLTSEEKKLLERFACKNKDATSKFVRLSKMVKDGDRSAIESISENFDEDKVKALIKLAKEVGGSDSKAKASLKAICSDSSDAED